MTEADNLRARRGEAYRRGPKTGNREPLKTAAVKRGLVKLPAFISAHALLDQEALAAIRYLLKLADYWQRNPERAP